jgi:hypothetical protein
MKEIRDIKIDLLMDNKNPIVDLFCNLTSGIEIINCDVYNKDGLEFIYHKDGQWIFYQDCKNEKFWTHYYKYWELFESKFHLKYDEIGAITKYLVVQSTLCIHKVEDALKREVGTPSGVMRISSLQVEEALKREVGTTKIAEYLTNEVVEDALKREMSKSKSKVRY